MTIAVHVSISPRWMNPQDVSASLMNYELMWKVHDNMIKPLPGNLYTYSLADHYEMADDYLSATIRLREGVKFHDGTAITSEDVKFSYDNYHGANAILMQDRTESTEIIDGRTVRFNFNTPFPDFLLFYGTPASGAGVIIPKDYYLSLGPDNGARNEAFIQNPIGAGPYRYVGQEPGIQVTFEAYEDYWRKVPHIKTIISRGVRELPVRVAALKSGEADFAYFMTGDLLQSVIDDPDLGYDPNNSAPFWLEFPDVNDPDSPFHDIRVRKAISLALDRQYLADQETAGMAIPTGNFIPPEWPGTVLREPDEYNLEEAKRLMAEAGYQDGFEIDWFTPFPAVESLSLRIMEQLREIGIETEMNVMERPVYMEKSRAGIAEDKMSHKGFPGRQIVQVIAMTPGDASTYVNEFLICGGPNSVICRGNIDELWQKYNETYDPAEREELMRQAQEIALDEYLVVPIYINAFTLGMGPRMAGQPQDYTQVPMSALPGPVEDFQLKPGS
jgi:peptide/nickel transport system substrate-binding protein